MKLSVAMSVVAAVAIPIKKAIAKNAMIFIYAFSAHLSKTGLIRFLNFPPFYRPVLTIAINNPLACDGYILCIKGINQG